MTSQCSSFSFLTLLFKIVGLGPVAGLPIEQVSRSSWYTMGQGLVPQFQPMGNGVPILNWQLIINILILIILTILLFSISMNINRSRSCLGKNLILKRLDSLKYFDWINLPSNDYAQVFWSIELPMIAANLLNQTTK